MPRPDRVPRRHQRGAMLLEALVALLIFSFGILGVVGLQAAAVQQSTDARYRSEAAQLVDQLIGQMWTTSRTPAALQASFNTCGGSTCTGYASWAATVATRLPGVNTGGTTKPVVNVDNSGIVTVTIYWKSPSDETAHQFSVEAQIVQ